MAVFHIAPFWLSKLYLSLVGALYYRFHYKKRRLIIKTIERVIGDRTRVAAHFRGIAMHYHEKLFVGYSNFPKLLDFLRHEVWLDGDEHLIDALYEGKGVIMVTAHFGGVELLPGTLALNDYPTTMVVRFKTKRLRDSMTWRANAVGLELIDTDGDNVLGEITNALAQGRILITECDEFDNWKRDRKRSNPFLSRHLPADRTLAILQKRTGARVVMALMVRVPGNRYVCEVTPINTGEGCLHQQCLCVLERAIMRYPEQWYQWRKFGTL